MYTEIMDDQIARSTRKSQEEKTGSTIVFVVDSSGSILFLLFDAYQKRDRVAMVAFRGTEAEML
jgi:magnesium chelatase subunit D